MKTPAQLYRTLLRTAIQIDEMKILGPDSALEDLMKSRGRYLFQDPLEGSHSYEESLNIRTEKAETFISSMELLKKNHTHSLLFSTYKAMLTRKGDYLNRKTMEDGVMLYMAVHQSPDYSHTLDDSHVGDRQNRVLQKAISYYSDRLAQIDQGHYDTLDASIKTTSFDLPEKVIVEVHDELNKQTIYIHTESSLDASEIEGAPVVEVEKLPGCMVHRSIFSRAQRVLDAILAETNIHRSRKTFIIGHGLGGSIATLVGLLLLGEQFEIANTITMGSNRAIESSKQRYIDRLNCMRAVIAEDPQAALPVSSERHKAFIHVGEVLVLHPEKPKFTVEQYNTYLADPNMPLSYTDSSREEKDSGPLADIVRGK